MLLQSHVIYTQRFTRSRVGVKRCTRTYALHMLDLIKPREMQIIIQDFFFCCLLTHSLKGKLYVEIDQFIMHYYYLAGTFLKEKVGHFI